jgi:hypothetical protein
MRVTAVTHEDMMSMFVDAETKKISTRQYWASKLMKRYTQAPTWCIPINPAP